MVAGVFPTRVNEFFLKKSQKNDRNKISDLHFINQRLNLDH